jgi:hypothetical protein
LRPRDELPITYAGYALTIGESADRDNWTTRVMARYAREKMRVVRREREPIVDDYPEDCPCVAAGTTGE